MFLIKIGSGTPMRLDRKLSESAGWGIYDFHRTTNSWVSAPPHQTYRFARIKPAEPKDGATVEVVLMLSPTAPEETWVSRGEGVAWFPGGV